MEVGVTVVTDLINPVPGDLRLGEDGDIVMVSTLIDEVIQRLTVRFEFGQGEWFMDLNQGTPWFQSIFGKGKRDALIRAVFTDIIEGTEGISRVLSIDYTLNKPTRELTLRFKALLTDGTTFNSEDFRPFVVSVVPVLT